MERKRGFRREIRRQAPVKQGTKGAITHPPVWPVTWNGGAVHIPAETPSGATGSSSNTLHIETGNRGQKISSSFDDSEGKSPKWLNNKESRSNAQKLPGKVLRGKQRWRRMGLVDDLAEGLAIPEYLDDSTEFFDYESDLSATLHLIHVESGGSLSPKALHPKLFRDQLRMSSSSISSGGSGSESIESSDFAALSDDDVDALAAPIPLRKTRSYVNKNLAEMTETLFSTIFPEEEVAGSGLTRTMASSQLAWDAADDSDEDEGSTTSDETFMIIGADGEGWIVPHIPKIEGVPTSWFHEQISNHANSYYKCSIDADPLLSGINPLLSDMTSAEMITCLVNGRLVLTMLEQLRGEDVRFTSPRLCVLQGLYRFGNGNGAGWQDIHPVRGTIARCLSEVIAHHANTMQNTVKSMRDNCLDPSMSNKAGLRSLYMHYVTDRGYPQLLELLEFAVLCENRELMLLYQEQQRCWQEEKDKQRSNGNISNNKNPSLPALFSSDATKDKLAQELIEIRLHSLLCATCAAIKTLSDDEFFENQSSNRDDSKTGQLESETANMLLNLQLVILTLAKCVHIECSYRLSKCLMQYLVRTWPGGEQCNPAQVYVKAVDIALQYAPPALAVPPPQPKIQLPPTDSPIMKTPTKSFPSVSDSAPPVLPQVNFRTPRRPLVEQCIAKLLQAVRSHHAKVAQIALQVMASPFLRVLLLQQEKACYDRADALDQSGRAGTSTAVTDSTFTGDSAASNASNKEEESYLVQLVSVLRLHRDCHWHPHVQSLSASLLDDLTDMMFNDSQDDGFDM